jgi:hypothetical protein
LMLLWIWKAGRSACPRSAFIEPARVG